MIKDKDVEECLNVDYVAYGRDLARARPGLTSLASKASERALARLAHAHDRLLLATKPSELHLKKEILFELWALQVSSQSED